MISLFRIIINLITKRKICQVSITFELISSLGGGGRSSSRSSSSSGRSGGMFSRGAPARQPVAAPRPPVAAPAQPTTTGGGMMSGLGGTIMTGMAFGAGSEVAH